MYLSSFGSRPVAVAACALALALPSCSDGDGPAGPGSPSAIAVALGSSSVSVTPGASNTVAVHITRTGGFAGAVTLSLEGAPAGLTGTFAPATVSAGATSSTLTLSAASSTAPGTHNLTIRASGQGVEAETAALALTVEAGASGAWSALGQGTNGPVYAMVVDRDGNLYAGGGFTRAGGTMVNNIAKWDGSSWSALGTGITGFIDTTVTALALDHDGNLYAAGQFTTAGGVAVRSVAMWDGSRWNALGEPPFDGRIGSSDIFALAVDSKGNLYVGGSWGGRMRGIVKWDGSTWSGVGNFFDEPSYRNQQGVVGEVRALVVDESDNIYVGGRIERAGGDTVAGGIVMWDGKRWNPLGEGVPWGFPLEGVLSQGAVFSLALDGDGNLYAGGRFTVAGGVTADNVAVWNGTEWNALGGGVPINWEAREYVFALGTDARGRLYAGGNFTRSAGAPADFLAIWNGAEWAPLGESLGGHVLAFAADGAGNLYAGGFFGPPYNYIARWRW